ncbi:unnamed protein product, partial [Candidula unifasciata]
MKYSIHNTARSLLQSARDGDSPLRTSSSTDTATSNDVDLSCGIGRLRTNIFGRRFTNLYVFAICFGLSNFFTSMLTSLERQFNIDNVRAGLFQTASRAGFISTVLFAGHFAKKANIPLVIGASGVLQGLVLTVPAIMQLTNPFKLQIFNLTDFGENAKYLCNTPVSGNNSSIATNTTTAEVGDTGVKQLQFLVVLAVQAFKGISDTFHNGFLPTLYMDDNLIDKTKMGVFLDDRFVAAWWLAFLVFGLGTAVFSLPVMLFPRKLISSRQKQEALDKAVVIFAGGAAKDEVVYPAGNGENDEAEPSG